MTAPAVRSSPGARLRAPSRLVGVDAARGVALLGMVATHVLALSVLDEATFLEEPTATALVAAGRASALFAVLAGVSLALATGGTRAPAGRGLVAARLGTAARAVVVAAIGLVVGSFGAPVAVILVNYGLLFLLVLPVLGWGPRRLLPLGAAWLLVVPVLLHPLRDAVVGAGLLPVGPGASTSLASLADPGLMVGELFLTGYYPVLSWAGFVVLGLGVGRLDLRRASTTALVALGGLVAAAGSAVVAGVLTPVALPFLSFPEGFYGSSGDLVTSLQTGLYGTTPTTTWWWLVVDAPHSGTPVDLAGVAGSALVVVGVLVLAAQHLPRVVRWLLWPLAAAGSMTLTLYSLHVLSLGLLRAWEAGGGIPPSEGTVYALQVVGLLVLGCLWQLTGLRGPLEALVASASRAARSGLR
ncbi:heparan-alpha-glucosaminide N-acetyltransferase domain-containing protein [Pseudokineococcus lusitanus]|uniref:Uncharacterized protein DUF1624 n=1 Tax=Pseudokineococcus lusitanus TaxID=763993 RepID=A0A3N1HMA2_9ACTN|nr:heparan-alpha-glucosaminide N-acetyltransferase domain-containing protein [Pseudokineococcus lusitanus]ROP43663.1 uncharacterized protein DUF1624 [Pseudokineococcus lusitanus]